MNHNIIESIISKTVFPLYLLEYGLQYSGKFPVGYHFFITGTYGLYNTMEEARLGVEALVSSSTCVCIYIRIKSIHNLGNIKEVKSEEYLYYDSEKYRRYKYQRLVEDPWGEHCKWYMYYLETKYVYKKIE